MPYQVTFNGIGSELFGYLFVQPFSFVGPGLFQRNSTQARVIAGIHYVSSPTQGFPSVSSTLPAPGAQGNLAIADSGGRAVLSVTNMQMSKIIPQQSIDVAMTYWSLVGSGQSAATFNPLCAFQYPPDGANYFPWRGSLSGGGANLAVTSTDVIFEAGAGPYISDFAAIGPANANGRGTNVVSFICGAGAGGNLPGLTFSDQSRASQTLLFDATAGGVAQVNAGAGGGAAQGAVFAYNGTFSRWAPDDVLRVVRTIASSAMAGVAAPAGRPTWFSDPAFSFPQSTSEAASYSGLQQHGFAQFGTDFEGLMVWNLRSRDNGYQQPLMF
jgi:hypothetical protein